MSPMHRARASLLLAAFAASLALPASAAAQFRYRLGSESTYQEGCFDPCMCPVMLRGPVTGTFVTTPLPEEGTFRVFAVEGVRWFVPSPQPLLVRGSGIYRIDATGSQQRLELDLMVGDDPVEHYDSGLVPVQAKFPDIAVAISVHGMFCWDTVFDLGARRVLRDPLRPKALEPEFGLPALPVGAGPQAGAPATRPLSVEKTWTGVKALYRDPNH